MLKEFKEFAMRGSVVDLAVGVIIGAAFGKIVESLVKDVIMPPIGLALGRVDFSNLFLVLREGGQHGPYATVEVAAKAGAVTLNLILAALMGVGIPMTLMKLGRDPAMGSSVLITAVTDSGGFFIFLGLATLFLL